MPTNRARPPRHAVVLGAGIAGLLAARVLAEHIDTVTVLEQDALPDQPTCRRGVPQGAHLHGLVLRGRQMIDHLLPDFTDDLIARGAPTFEFAADVAIRTPFGWGRRVHADLHSVSASRALTEWVIRHQVTTWPAITIMQRTRVVGLTGTATRVDAVRVRTVDDSIIDELPADLVIDATGRGSRSRPWLRELGCAPHPEHTIDPHVGYASRVYRIPTGNTTTWKACYLQATQPGPPRGAALLPIEDNRWIVTLIGIGPDRPTRHEADFLPFAHSLPSPIIADALRTAEPLTDVAVSNSTSNQRRLFHRMPPHPGNLIVIGDAACSFNPVYAQGMTAAAMAAILLNDCLSTYGLPRSTRHFPRCLHTITKRYWTLAVTADSRSPHTTGPPATLQHRISGRYLDRVLLAGTHDPHVHLAFLHVLHMLRTPTSLLKPAIAARVMRHHNQATGAIGAEPPLPTTFANHRTTIPRWN